MDRLRPQMEWKACESLFMALVPSLAGSAWCVPPPQPQFLIASYDAGERIRRRGSRKARFVEGMGGVEAANVQGDECVDTSLARRRRWWFVKQAKVSLR
jgi:hypothetical protein